MALRIVAVDAGALRPDEVQDLYSSVGWTAYTEHPDVLAAALHGSSYLLAAFDQDDGRLVGLARAISDDASICYVQDVLVHPDRRREGIATALMQGIAQRYAHVRQHVLLTDDEAGQRAFYESLGYTEVRDFGEGTLRAFVRFRRAAPA
jgi:predicted GNAT family acetyltransferase